LAGEKKRERERECVCMCGVRLYLDCSLEGNGLVPELEVPAHGDLDKAIGKTWAVDGDSLGPSLLDEARLYISK